MSMDFEKGVAFILEGETEKVFYFSLLNHLCKRNSPASIEKHTDTVDGEIFYVIKNGCHNTLLKFNVVGTVSQIANSGNWFEKRCYSQNKSLNWTVFLCYDTDNYVPNISKFYEGDWAELRKTISKHKSCCIIDLAAQADIEDIILLDADSIYKFLDIPPMPIPSGGKGKTKLKKIFRSKQPQTTYHEGARAEPLINSLNFEKIISASPIPLSQIETVCFGYKNN